MSDECTCDLCMSVEPAQRPAHRTTPGPIRRYGAGATLEERLDAALAEVRGEALKAARKFKPFNSPHEGYAVILEELDELWDDVKANRGRQSEAHTEAKQTAAMAVRYMLDITGSCADGEA